MDAWLTSARDALAETVGIPAEELSIDDGAADTLLDLARIAAHTSGDRTNAPLLAYLIGRADDGTRLDELAAAVRRL